VIPLTDCVFHRTRPVRASVIASPGRPKFERTASRCPSALNWVSAGLYPRLMLGPARLRVVALRKTTEVDPVRSGRKVAEIERLMREHGIRGIYRRKGRKNDLGQGPTSSSLVTSISLGGRDGGRPG
jgi:hypothetical protein